MHKDVELPCYYLTKKKKQKNNLVKEYLNYVVIFQGQFSDRASSPSEIKILVGSYPCNVTFLSRTQVVCSLHTSHYSLSSDVNDFPSKMNVRIKIGNFITDLGYILMGPYYQTSLGNAVWRPFDSALIGSLVGACSALALIIGVSFFVWWKRKNWRYIFYCCICVDCLKS